MLLYFFKRFFLMIPTLLGIMFFNFIIIQAAPGGPIEQILIRLKDGVSDVDARLGGVQIIDDGYHSHDQQMSSKSNHSIDPQFIENLKIRFGFDKPWWIRFAIMVKNYVTFDFGQSYFKNESVISLIKEKLPVSISLGVWATLLIYCISIPLGIRKAVRDGSSFDITTSILIIIAYAIPSFLLALFLIIVFAGGSFWQIFPLRGLVSINWHEMTWSNKIFDYGWHMVLPITALVLSGFAKLTMFVKNAFLEEINKQYVLCARAKGISPHRVLYHHIFRNAMLVVIAGFPAAFIHMFFTSSLLIEVLFSLDGLGLLGFDAALSRDYPVMFASVYIFSLIAMGLHLIGDVLYMVVDRRIDLEKSQNY